MTRLQNGSIIGLNKYAHATWLTSLNQDLAYFGGVRNLEIAFSKLSQEVTPDCYLEASKLDFFSVEDNSIFFAQQQVIKSVIEGLFYVFVKE